MGIEAPYGIPMEAPIAAEVPGGPIGMLGIGMLGPIGIDSP